MATALRPIKGDNAFRKITAQGRWLNSRIVSICYLAISEPSCFVGIRAPKRIKLAVNRNKMKRRIRAALEKHKERFRFHGYFLIVIKAVGKIQAVEKDLNSLIDQLPQN